jgi:hypothetical protein
MQRNARITLTIGCFKFVLVPLAGLPLARKGMTLQTCYSQLLFTLVLFLLALKGVSYESETDSYQR